MKSQSKARVNVTQFLLKDFFIGLAIFFVPLASFLKPYNLRQLALFDLYLILGSQIVILLVLFVLSTFLYFTTMKIFKARPNYIFLLTCFGFYLLFLFNSLHKIVQNTLFQDGGAAYFTLTCLFVLWLTLCFLVIFSHKFALVFSRSIIIFASINILISLLSLLLSSGYVSELWIKKSSAEFRGVLDMLTSEDFNLSKSVNQSRGQTVYYIILDGMIGLEFAAKSKLVDDVETKLKLQQAGFTYIDRTYSSYDVTKSTLGSIMEVDYPFTEKSDREIARKHFFPSMMYQNDKLITLPELIKNIGSKFIWVGNANMSCLEIVNQPWTCIHSNRIRNLMRLSSTIYFNTPLKLILKLKPILKHRMLSFHQEGDYWSDNEQRNIKQYIEYSRSNRKIKNNKFVFIHQMSPHSPFYVSENCTPQNYIDEYEGYKASYRCVLKEVLEFITHISVDDPNAIVVFQGDHGWLIPGQTKTSQDKLEYLASIFNAIKAPEECFARLGKPHSTVNTIRFVLNCAYGFNLPYLPTIHYQVSYYFLTDNEKEQLTLAETTAHIF